MLSNIKNKRIHALLACSRFLAVEPQGDRARDNLTSVKKIMNGNVEKTGEKSVTINLSPNVLEDTTADGKPIENSFNSIDLILSMDAAMDFDEKIRTKQK